MPDALHLVKVPIVASALSALARSHGLPLRHLDDGYLCHWVLRAAFGELAPSPFVLRGAGRVIDAWGYSVAERNALLDHAQSFGDPSVLPALGTLGALASRLMPVFENGRRLGFVLRACPVARLARPVNGHRAGAEVDVFLARCFAVGPDAAVSREEVYREWLVSRLGRDTETGCQVESVRVAGFTRERLVRRTQGADRRATRLERPDVTFDGDIVVTDGPRLLDYLRRGVGRHRAFGFGALIIVPPGTSYSPQRTEASC